MRYLKVLFVIFSGCLFKLPSNYTLTTNEDASKLEVTSHLPGVNKGPLTPPVIKTPPNPLPVQDVQSPQDKIQDSISFSTEPSNTFDHTTPSAPVQNTDSPESEPPKLDLLNQTQINETATTEVPSTQVPLSQGSDAQEKAAQATTLENNVVTVDNATLPETITSHENSSESDSLSQIDESKPGEINKGVDSNIETDNATSNSIKVS